MVEKITANGVPAPENRPYNSDGPYLTEGQGYRFLGPVFHAVLWGL